MATALPILQQTRDAGMGAATWPLRAPAHRDLCTDCGLSRTALARRCGQACQFIAPDYERLERATHGRARDPRRPDELHFGPFVEMVRARLRRPADGAQWSGITTRVAERLLETGRVDGVIATAAQPDDRWAPRPVLVRRAADMAQCRGMKMGYSPVLALLEQAAAEGMTRLAIVGVPCQVHALRAVERELGLEALYVIGTPCSDNTTTARFHAFLALLAERPEEVTYLEFRTDMRVELRFRDGSTRLIPFPMLPIEQLQGDFLPLTCRSCFDYANALADLTVGYVGGDGDQWLLVRNARGRALLDLVQPELETAPLATRGRRAGVVRSFIAMSTRARGGLPLRRAPRWARPLIGWMMRRFGPRGLEFARARIEMKLAEGVLSLRHERPRRVRRLVPSHAWELLAAYGVVPATGERPITTERGGRA
jgi:coenzyme F420 hydrogenase subunit beta